MLMNNKCIAPFIGFLACITLFALSCSSSEKTTAEESEREEPGYVSTTGSEEIRDEIMKNFESIKRLQNSVVYRTFQFDLDAMPSRDDVRNEGPRTLATNSVREDHSTAGTAVVLGNQRGRSTLLTAAHVVSFADTIWHESEVPGRLEAVSVIESKNHLLMTDDGFFGIDPVIIDQRRDLALLLHRWRNDEDPGLEPLDASPGNHEELDWTDMVYALGYPRGFQMVTRGMVSKFMTIPRRSFVIDAPFNRGFSGGVLFSVRRDGTGLEWVGVLSAAYAESEYVLTPGDMESREYNPNIEYDGPIHLERRNRLNYGITYAVGMEEVGQFFRENRDEIRRLRLSVPSVPE